MSKRFKAKIDWHDSEWIDIKESAFYSAIRYIGPFTLFVREDGTTGAIGVKGTSIWSKPYSDKQNAKRGCERALTRLLK